MDPSCSSEEGERGSLESSGGGQERGGRSFSSKHKEKRRRSSSSSPSPSSSSSPSPSSSSSSSPDPNRSGEDAQKERKKRRFSSSEEKEVVSEPVPVYSHKSLFASIPTSRFTSGGGSRFSDEPVQPALEAPEAEEEQGEGDSQEKLAKELFIGNFTPGATDEELRAHLNWAMRHVGLVSEQEPDPVVGVRMSAKFAFALFGTPEAATRGMDLNGLPFREGLLRFGRPSKFQGDVTVHRSWQELVADVEGRSSRRVVGEEVQLTPSPAVQREIYIGNVTPDASEADIRQFFGQLMQVTGLACFPGNPITGVRHAGTYAFIELRCREEASNALCLDGVVFKGEKVQLGRPAKYAGSDPLHMNWAELMAKWQSGRGSVQVGRAGAPSKVVCLQNLVLERDLEEEEDFEALREDVELECEEFGEVEEVLIPRLNEQAAGSIFVKFQSELEASKCIAGLQGRTYDDRVVFVKFHPEDMFDRRDFSFVRRDFSEPFFTSPPVYPSNFV